MWIGSFESIVLQTDWSWTWTWIIFLMVVYLVIYVVSKYRNQNTWAINMILACGMLAGLIIVYFMKWSSRRSYDLLNPPWYSFVGEIMIRMICVSGIILMMTTLFSGLRSFMHTKKKEVIALGITNIIISGFVVIMLLGVLLASSQYGDPPKLASDLRKVKKLGTETQKQRYMDQTILCNEPRQIKNNQMSKQASKMLQQNWSKIGMTGSLRQHLLKKRGVRCPTGSWSEYAPFPDAAALSQKMKN